MKDMVTNDIDESISTNYAIAEHKNRRRYDMDRISESKAGIISYVALWSCLTERFASFVVLPT